MFRYGSGGVAHWGTLCGTMVSAGAILNLASKDYGDIIHELMGWYTEYPFPSNRYDAYCKFPEQVQTVAKSPLCHASVSKWADVVGTTVSSQEKKDRCAKVTGDTAFHMIELLNQHVDGKFTAIWKPSEEFSHCTACHTGKESALNNEQGYMNCTPCHTDHTK